MRNLTLSCVFFGVAVIATAEARLASVFGDHMVLQRDANVPVWGTAEPGETVAVSFNGQNLSVKADSKGKWEAILLPMKFGGPFGLTVQGTGGGIALKDVLVGDVWLFSGQSNAPWSVVQDSKGQEALALADKFPQIRHSVLPYLNNTCEYPLGDFPEKVVWNVGGAKTAKFGHPTFFLQKIHQATGIPQGFVLVARAATQIEAWTSMEGFDSVQGLDEIQKKILLLRPETDEYRKASQVGIDYGRKWLEDARKADAANQLLPPMIFPTRVHYTVAHHYPTFLYNGSTAPLTPMALKGVFWYQGESNVGDTRYKLKLMAFTNGLRKAFRNPDLPFFIVQPCPYKGYSQAASLPIVWEQQQDFVDADGKSYLCLTSDIGDVNDWHPKDKRDINYRMADLALKYLYGMKGVKADFPRCEKFAVNDDKFVITFKFAEQLRTIDGKSPNLFEIAGADGEYQPASAVIDKNTVILSSEKVPHPLNARFAWSNIAEPNLRNEAGLPPGAFRTERKSEAGSDGKKP